MPPLQVISSANQLLQQNAAFVQDWVRSVQEGQLDAPKDFNWLGLAEVAASQAHRSLDNNDSRTALTWADIAISVYEQLAHDVSPSESFTFIDSAMRLRAGMIQKLGMSTSQAALNYPLLVSWALEDLSYEAVQEKVERWINHKSDRDYVLTHIDEIRQLRKLKIKLNALAIVWETAELTEAAQQWLSLRRKLP